MMPLMLRLSFALAFLFSVGCSTIDHSPAPKIPSKEAWVVLPFANHTETPLAGHRAEAIAESLLRSNGINRLRRYPSALSPENLFDSADRKQNELVLEWARSTGARYALTGSVDEWRYKVGVDGEPAVGLTLSIVDLGSGETLWNAAGGQSGWSREALSAVAQQLMRRLLRAGLVNRRD